MAVQQRCDRLFRAARAVLLVVVGLLSGGVLAGLPPGFVQDDVVSMSGSSAIDWTPDGALWIAQSGPGEGMRIYVHRDGVLRSVLQFPGFPTGERGIHEIAVDPDYASNGWIWVYRTILEDPAHNRLSRFLNPRAFDPQALDGLVDEVVIWEGPELAGLIHNGGCLAFASDGTLFIATGDDTQASTTSQDLFDQRGKLLHMNRDGSPAADNPYDGTDGDPLVWARGLRNPFRCAMQAGLDNLFVGDVGNRDWEEINIGVRAANYGWALVEGPEPPGVSGMVYPIYSYPHDDPAGAAVILGGHAGPGDFNPLYEGNFFFADWARGKIYRMVLDDANNVVNVETFADSVGYPVDLAFGPDGALYYATRGVHRIRRIRYVGGENRQPVAVATATPDSGPAPLLVTLDGSGSFDPDDDPLSHSWATGDGADLVGEQVMHEYAAGVHVARLTVDDGQGLSATSPPVRIVSGNERPQPSIATPAQAQTYNAGDTIGYSGSAFDPEEGALDCSRLSWQVLFHHDVHTHPFIGPSQGDCAGEFTVPTVGEESPHTWFSIRLQATDTGVPLGPGAELDGSHVVEIFPNTAWMHFETAPLPDLELSLDTAPLAAPASVEGVVGFTRTIGAPDSQLRDGRTWRWRAWSDGGAKDHAIATPASDTTFVATFGCNVLAEAMGLTLEPLPDGRLRLSWDPVDDDPCLSAEPGVKRYRIFAAATPRPEGPGAFPSDPQYHEVAATDDTTYDLDTGPGDVYFIVAVMGSDGEPGGVGHYDQ